MSCSQKTHGDHNVKITIFLNYIDELFLSRLLIHDTGMLSSFSNN